MGWYIPRDKRARLLKYKYSSTDKSLTSKYLLGPYWNWLVKLFPSTMAPNAITLLGLACVGVNVLSLLYFNPSLACGSKPAHVSRGGEWDPLFKPHRPPVMSLGWLKWLGWGSDYENAECAPQWLFYSFAIGLFVYQSLDAIDGKQARRTGQSGPLGELFDHCCDAINTTLGVILCASALNLGLGWWTVASLVATTANFYLTTWEEFHTGTLYLSAFSGPVEGILIICAIFLITGRVGPSFWDTGILSFLGIKSNSLVESLPIKDLPLNECFLLFSLVGLLFNIVSAAANVSASLPSVRANSMIRPLGRLLPYTVHTTAMIYWLAHAHSILGTVTLVPFLLFWGVSFAHHVGMLILAHLSSSRFPAVYKHPNLVLALLGAIDAKRGYVQRNLASEQTVVGLCLVFAAAVYGHFVWEVIGDICEFYDINCLTIKHKKPEDAPDKVKNALPANSEAAAVVRQQQQSSSSPSKKQKRS